MPLTRDFRETVMERAVQDFAFRAALLREGLHALLTGDIGVGGAILHDYITACTGGIPHRRHQ